MRISCDVSHRCQPALVSRSFLLSLPCKNFILQLQAVYYSDLKCKSSSPGCHICNQRYVSVFLFISFKDDWFLWMPHMFYFLRCTFLFLIPFLYAVPVSKLNTLSTNRHQHRPRYNPKLRTHIQYTQSSAKTPNCDNKLPGAFMSAGNVLVNNESLAPLTQPSKCRPFVALLRGAVCVITGGSNSTKSAVCVSG